MYANRMLELAALKAGAAVRVLWEIDGPKDTSIAKITCLQIGGCVVLVETFDGGGWEAFSAARTNDVYETIADVLNRCDVPYKP